MLGLIAGAGLYPLEVIRAAKRLEEPVAVVALARLSVAAVEQEAALSTRLPVGALAAAASFLRRAGIQKAILAGGVPWKLAATRPRPDRHSFALLPQILAGDDALLRATADSLDRLGVEVIGPGRLIEDLRCPVGRLAGPPLDARSARFAQVAMTAARNLGRSDGGQAALAAPSGVLVESRSGTDALLRRATTLAGGAVLAKAAKENQDRRFDLPAIGPNTMALAVRVGVRAVIVEARRTLILAREETLSRCDHARITLIGIERG